MYQSSLDFLKLVKRTCIDIPLVVWGFVVYFFKKTTPPKAYQALINLFCLTGGYSNKVFSKTVALIHKPYKIKHCEGVLGHLNDESLQNINKQLNDKGYYIFENTLSETDTQALLDFAYQTPTTIRGDSIQSAENVLYDPAHPKATRYDFSQQDLIDHPIIQKLITDLSLLEVAQTYLKSKPVLDVIGMWWHTAYQKTPDSASAQLFHFDMDRLKWLKFFIYLTDVSIENGPHVFVEGSHKNKGIPNQFRAKGYARLSDESVFSFYGKRKIKYHVAPRGTIIAEDTRGLHKGQHVIKGDRLVLQIQFSNHLFGAYYPKIKFHNLSDDLKHSVQQYPRTYMNYL